MNGLESFLTKYRLKEVQVLNVSLRIECIDFTGIDIIGENKHEGVIKLFYFAMLLLSNEQCVQHSCKFLVN